MKTRRRRRGVVAAAAAAATKILEVRSPSQIQELEGVLSKGPMTLVLVFADWCPACHRFMKELWKPMCAEKFPASMNRAAVREDLVAKTSLANSQYKYLPTLMLVGTDKRPATFESPEGSTNAMPTPRTPDELKRIVSLPAASPATGVSTPQALPQADAVEVVENNSMPLEANDNTADTIPKQQGGCGCMMRGGGASGQPQVGGLYDVLMRVEQGTLPLTQLMHTASALSTKQRGSTRKTRRRGSARKTSRR